jgi:hypothetical protein
MEVATTPIDQLSIDLAREQWLGYARAQDFGHRRYVVEAKTFDNYYIGGDFQWDADIIAKLDREERPHHTVNLVLSTVNAVLGRYVAMRQDIAYKPVRRGASSETGKVLTKLARHISDDSHSRWVEKQVFSDGVIQDRGFFDIRLDMEENVGGEIRETALDPIDVLLDPGAREYDPKTWSEVYLTRWMTPEEIRAMYGEKAGDSVRYIGGGSETYGSDSVIFDPVTFADDRAYYSQGPYQFNYGDDWKRVKRIRVIERQYRKFTIRSYFIDQYTGDIAPVPESWEPAKVTAVAKQYQLQVVMRPERRIRWTVTADRNILKDGWSPYRRFTVIPFFPYFRRGRPFGVVRNLISPQDMLNKTLSQELHVVNTTANSGWVVEAGSLINMTVQQLAQQGAKTGLVVEFQRGSTPPAKIGANQIPTGLDRLSQKATMHFREISGISDAMLGQPGREISGEALDAKKSSGFEQLDGVFDNLAFTRQLRAEMILEIVQDFYTEERILTICAHGEEGEEQDEELRLNYENAVGEILNDVTVGEYKVVVSSRPSRDVEDESQLQRLLAMKEAGVMIPDWAILEVSGLDKAKELADWNRRMTGAADPTPEEIQQMQMVQELEMRRAMAELDELQARAEERMAHAQLMLTQAEAVGESERAEIVKFGAQLRAGLEKDAAAAQQKREELQARISIMQLKNQSTNYTAQLQALTKRLDTEAKERVENKKVVVAARKPKAKAK